MSQFTTRIIKGGALLAETRRLLDVWNEDVEGTLSRLHASETFGKTRARQKDILMVLRRRFLDVGYEVAEALKRLANDPTAFRQACYYEAARTDGLLSAFAAGPLFSWYRQGHREVSTADVVSWLGTDSRSRVWNPRTRERVARGLLSTLRDFGLLEGTVRGRCKRIRVPQLSLRAFSYIALREGPHCSSDRAILQAPVWRWFLLDEQAVRKLFLEADRAGALRFSEAGRLLRVDWLVQDLEEAVDVSPA